MQSFFRKYHNFRRKKQIQTIVLACILAIWANALIFSPIGGNLQASIIQIQEPEFHANLQVVHQQDSIAIQTLTPTQDIQDFNTTLLYNPETTQITSITTKSGKILEISNTPPHIIRIVYNTSTDLENMQEVIQIQYEKQDTASIPISLVDTYVTHIDNKKQYLSVAK